MSPAGPTQANAKRPFSLPSLRARASATRTEAAGLGSGATGTTGTATASSGAICWMSGLDAAAFPAAGPSAAHMKRNSNVELFARSEFGGAGNLALPQVA